MIETICSAFKPFLEAAPEARQLAVAFHASNYSACLAALNNIKVSSQPACVF